MLPYAWHWFRRDLRVAGNLALKRQFSKFEGRVLGIFCFDKKFLSRPDMSYPRFQFFLNTLVSLRQELRSLGGDLLVLDEGPEQAFLELFKKMQDHQVALPECISWARDYEPFARARDEKIKKIFKEWGIETYSHRDHLLVEPHELAKEDGTPYKVFTPFAKKWNQLVFENQFSKRIEEQKQGLTFLGKLKKEKVQKVFSLTWSQLIQSKFEVLDHLNSYQVSNMKKVNIDIPPAGCKAAFSQLEAFALKLGKYGERRDIPFESATSGLSVFLKNGSLTIAQIMAYLDLKTYQKKQISQDIFLSELIWREFYYHILWHFPRVETESFIEKYQNIKWQNSPHLFEAWKQGRTGFPLVDAGMRQLNTTGLMHNRVRMVVASFLVKDLLIDWRWGEKYFMEKLLDGDLAANNGGWQWAASTGCDPQPYFRIFNPWLQSEKFDPQGLYIKTYVPELSNVEGRLLHQPILGHPLYPPPVVDHAVQKKMALKLYDV